METGENMIQKYDSFYTNIRSYIFKVIKDKKIDIDELSFKLGISKKDFLKNFTRQITDYTFYLQTLSIVERW